MTGVPHGLFRLLDLPRWRSILIWVGICPESVLSLIDMYSIECRVPISGGTDPKRLLLLRFIDSARTRIDETVSGTRRHKMVRTELVQ